MADNSPLDMNYILDEFAEVQKLPPVLAGKRVDVLRRDAWKRLAKKGIVVEVTDTNFLGRAVSTGKNSHVYRTQSGLYEIWLEQRLGNKGDVDIIVWELKKDGDQVISAKATGMDAHSVGPLDPAATPNHITHFEKKEALMKRWQEIAREEGIQAEVAFDETQQFWWKQRLRELRGLEEEAHTTEVSRRVKEYLTKESPAARIFRAIGVELTIADTGLHLLQFELAIYQSTFFHILSDALAKGDYARAKRITEGAIDLPVGGSRSYASDLYGKLVEAFPVLGVGAMSETIWDKLMKKLRLMIDETAKRQKPQEEGSSPDHGE